MVATTSKVAVEDKTKKGPAVGGGGGEGEVGVNRSYYTLMDVSFRVKKGQLIAVVGSVGSGKSSLLSGLLGEMQLQQGKVRVCGKIAYCDQRPWIMNTTVRDNILFGLEYDEARFDMALHASSLEDDIKVVPGSMLPIPTLPLPYPYSYLTPPLSLPLPYPSLEDDIKVMPSFPQN